MCDPQNTGRDPTAHTDPLVDSVFAIAAAVIAALAALIIKALLP